ncbi:MAG: hypothetical protein B6D39_02190 [Anaerolineae bacterium UTCFX2]|jgi:UPF0755 protein|nr:endolytic transglycosylase MltG [Anaerolineales bacterium]OQY94074.1 MAG: hypothetical protein B6D39_02190 [Anaerolineae bacterium UTCFX2]
MKNSSLFNTLVTLTLIVLCLIIGISGWLAYDLPRRAERVFGTASPKVGFLQRLELSAQLLAKEQKLIRPLDPSGASLSFEIQPGESTYSITNRLRQSGLIQDEAALRGFLVYAGLDTSLQSGEFKLSPRMTAIEIAWALQDTTPDEVTFRILPGWRLEEIAASLPTSGLEFSPDQFLAVAKNPPQQLEFSQQLPPGASLEGYMFPDSYRLMRKTSVMAFVETVLQNFQIKVDQDLQNGFTRQGLDLHQAVTLASLIQREAVLQDEMPMIASVFLNRLEAGMKLDSDPTVQFALGYDRKNATWWKNPLSLNDLKVNSNYNTYLHPELPPGPIASPGLSALQAVAFPAQAPYYYFRSACDGSGAHAFAETFEQHKQNACPE